MNSKKARVTSQNALLAIILSNVTVLLAAAAVLLYFHMLASHMGLLLLLAVMLAEAVFLIGEFELFIHPIRRLEQMVDPAGIGYPENADELGRGIWRRQQATIDHLIRQVQEAIHNDYTSQMLKSQAEMQALQSQINPHFLYNTLETIRSHALSKKSFDIAEMTEALATLFRYSISRPGEMATFAEEMGNVDSYMIIQQYRFSSRFKIVKEIEDDSILNYRLPILTIQPIVENAIHHGLETKMGPGTVTIRAYSTQSRLVIEISDDGSGMSEERLKEIRQELCGMKAAPGRSPKKHGGIALLNVDRRLKFYFGPEYGLTVYSTRQVGTSVGILLPKI